MNRDIVYLRHILDAILRIEEYTAEGENAFFASPQTQDATIGQLEIIGEATKHLSSEFCDSHASVPWRRIAGMRDVLIHDYMGVEIRTVWQTVERYLPELRTVVTRAIGEEDSL